MLAEVSAGPDPLVMRLGRFESLVLQQLCATEEWRCKFMRARAAESAKGACFCYVAAVVARCKHQLRFWPDASMVQRGCQSMFLAQRPDTKASPLDICPIVFMLTLLCSGASSSSDASGRAHCSAQRGGRLGQRGAPRAARVPSRSPRGGRARRSGRNLLFRSF